MSLISTTTPLTANSTFTSGVQTIARANYITGSVIADQGGTLFIDQGGDGTDWDVTQTLAIAANSGVGFTETLVSPYFRVRYTNGSLNQATFRLFVDARDPFGAFLQSNANPTSGGAYIALYFDPVANAYTVVGRFDGTDTYNVNEQAAMHKNLSGKYASALVSSFTATQETVQLQSNSASTAF